MCKHLLGDVGKGHSFHFHVNSQLHFEDNPIFIYKSQESAVAQKHDLQEKKNLQNLGNKAAFDTSIEPCATFEIYSKCQKQVWFTDSFKTHYETGGNKKN